MKENLILVALVVATYGITQIPADWSLDFEHLFLPLNSELQTVGTDLTNQLLSSAKEVVNHLIDAITQ